MNCNQNEKYLLKFISMNNDISSNKNDLLEEIFHLGIKIRFNNYNPVYQIIDELNFSNRYNDLIRK